MWWSVSRLTLLASDPAGGGHGLHPRGQHRSGAQPGPQPQAEGLGGVEAREGGREAGEVEEGGGERAGDCSQLRTWGQWHHSLPGKSLSLGGGTIYYECKDKSCYH